MPNSVRLSPLLPHSRSVGTRRPMGGSYIGFYIGITNFYNCDHIFVFFFVMIFDRTSPKPISSLVLYTKQTDILKSFDTAFLFMKIRKNTFSSRLICNKISYYLAIKSEVRSAIFITEASKT